MTLSIVYVHTLSVETPIDDANTGTASLLGSELSHPLKKTDQRTHVRLAQMTEPAPMLLNDGIFDTLEHLHGTISDPGTNQSPIGLAPRSCDKTRVLHPIEKTRHVRHTGQHAVAHFIPAESVRFGAAQNAEHVVLRQGNPLGLQNLLELV